MRYNWRKLIFIFCAVLVIAALLGGTCFYLINSRKMTVSINEITMKVPKDLIVVSDNENDGNIYVDVLDMLKLQEIPVHVGDFGITVLLRGLKVVRLNPVDNAVVVNGDVLDLTEEDYFYDDGKLYLTEELFRRLFEQAIIYTPEDEIKFAVYDVSNFRMPKNLTVAEYFNMSSEERERLILKNPNKQKVFELQVTIIPGDELNPVIRDAYNEVVDSFDFYRQYQFYNWHKGLDESSNLTGYLLCSNAQSILWQFGNMKKLREVAEIKEFTAKDIEYINRINTIYNAFDFNKVKLLGPSIEAYKNRLDTSISGVDVYERAAEKALKQFNETFKVAKVDRLPIPAWAEYDSYHSVLKNVPYINQEETLLKMVEQLLDYIPDDVKDSLEWLGIYKDAKEIILAAYPEWGDYLPDTLMDEALEELIANLKDGSVKNVAGKVKSALGKVDIVEIYDGINLFKDVLNLVTTERGNDFFTELKRSKVKSMSNIFQEVVDPLGMIKSGLELGNANLVSAGCLLGLEFYIASEFMSRIEELGKFVSGMILMSFDTDSIDDVYSGNITMEEYLDGE